LLGVVLVEYVGHAGLLLIATGALAIAALAAWRVHRWRDRQPSSDASATVDTRDRRLGGNPFAGAAAVLRSPYLLAVAVFMLLLAPGTTFLSFERARLVEARFPGPVDPARVFAIIDTVVQGLSILSQLFITGHVARRFGVGVLLVAVPLVAAAGFVWLAF